jgi:hypothetical protein
VLHGWSCGCMCLCLLLRSQPWHFRPAVRQLFTLALPVMG